MTNGLAAARPMPLIAMTCALAAAGCTTSPPVDDGLASAEGAVLAGDVVILAPMEEAHPVILFLTRVSTDETGSPIVDESGRLVTETADVAVVPEGALTQGDDAGFGRTGRYTLSPVRPGLYALGGFVDVDENFNLTAPAAPPDPDPDLYGGWQNLGTGDQLFLLSAGQVADEINVWFMPAATPASTPSPTPSATPTASATP